MATDTAYRSIINALFVSLLCASPLLALPQYVTRSARVCDNCHTTFKKTSYQEQWTNPPLPDRLCNLSCQTCHVNPAGGGMRNAPGRYYAASTLAMNGARNRPARDRGTRNLMTWLTSFAPQLFTTKAPSPDTKSVGAPPQRDSIPHWLYRDDPMSFGHPLFAGSAGHYNRWAFRPGRYGTINADPLLAIGGDLRLALYSAGEGASVFPMQADIGTALHPVEHLTLSATVGLQGRTAGFKESFNDPANAPLKIQNAFVLLHELPMASYLQAGAFLPEFGIRLDDHTLLSRRYLEMDHSIARNLVQGVQIGMAPNYPYFSAAGFATLDSNGIRNGFGASANAAFRGEKWGYGGSYLLKKRDFADGGNLQAGAVNGYINAWGLIPRLRFTRPITAEMEYCVAQSDRTAQHSKLSSAWLFELDYLLFNGLNLRVTHSFYDSDWQLADDFTHRFGFGGDLNPLRSVRITPDVRVTLPATLRPSADFLLFVHYYW